MDTHAHRPSFESETDKDGLCEMLQRSVCSDRITATNSWTEKPLQHLSSLSRLQQATLPLHFVGTSTGLVLHAPVEG